MLQYLHLRNVGPAPELEMELAPRLNLITGDNGVGKSFLLDVAWWALTRRWPHDLNPRLIAGYPGRPTDPGARASIELRLRSTSKTVSYVSEYARRDEAWVGKAGRPSSAALVVYAHTDGGFSVWDPARNYWKKKGTVDIQERLPGYVFSAAEVWDGLTLEVEGAPTVVCNGLIRDWAIWIREKGSLADLMATVVQRLSPEGESLTTGPLTRLRVNDARDIPSIQTACSDAVPIVHASSGIRRILALAYVLVWAWNEHVIAAAQLGEQPTSQVVLLFDEIENHLHPRWQRSILSSVLHVAEPFRSVAALQLLAVTHSPLVLASAEPLFDPARDAWFDMDFVPGEKAVTLEKRPFVRRGTAGRWLTSQAFDLPSEGRSLEAERAIAGAEALLERRRKGLPPNREEIDAADRALRAVLPDVDRFWVRWSGAVDDLRESA